MKRNKSLLAVERYENNGSYSVRAFGTTIPSHGRVIVESEHMTREHFSESSWPVRPAIVIAIHSTNHSLISRHAEANYT